MKFLLFASALAVLSSAAAHDDRRRTSTGTIHFSEQVDGALKLIQKGTNSKVDGSPIQQLIYKEESSGGSGGGKESSGGDDKGRKNDDNDANDNKGGDKNDDNDDNDRKGGGNKDSSSSNDRKGGGSSSSSNDNRKGGGSSSSSSSSGDTRAIGDICHLGHNACDHDNENKGKKGSDSDDASKIECDIVCSSTLCSHDDRERMGCPPLSTAKFVQKGAEFKNAASPIQQLIYKEEEEGGSDVSGDTKDDKDDEDRKGGGDNKDSSSSNDRKGGPSSSSSNDRKGGPSSSSSGDNGPSNDDFCDLNDCGADNLKPDEQDLCDVACLACDIKPPGCPTTTSGDDERAWKKNLRRRNRKND